jgi:hypothetical protein
VIRWVRLAAACATSLSLVVLLAEAGFGWVGVIAAAGNLLWVGSAKFPSRTHGYLQHMVLVINTVASAWGALAGGPAAPAVVVAVGSLLSWNASIFLERWQDRPPLPVERRYLRRAGGMAALGLGGGLSAVVLQGQLSLPFPFLLVAMVCTGLLIIRLFSQALRPARQEHDREDSAVPFKR